MNFLESVVAEWYVYTGYFVRTNVRARKRAKGGYDMELDVLAYKPASAELVHVETSGDADSWTHRRERFLKKKFLLGPDEYKVIIGSEVRFLHRVALVGYSSSTRQSLDWGEGIEVKLIPDFFREITASMRKLDPMKTTIPEGFPILRAIQFAAAFCR